jgi:pimeloyl-ACP methyl ester carboxylesterase
MKRLFYLTIILCTFNLLSAQTDSFVDVQDFKLHIKVQGEGMPVVIFENGMGSSMDAWKSIPDEVSTFATTFCYDRAGLGKSELSSNPRTIPNMVEELREALRKQNLQPPYIYVAHSMGSYVARYFAMTYPEEIKAILLVDPSPDKMYDEYSEEEYKNFKQYGNQSYADAQVGTKLEWENYLDNRKYVQTATIPDAIPVVILSATQWDFFEYHKQIMNNHPKSRHLKVEGSHDLHQEQPDLIVQWIKAFL